MRRATALLATAAVAALAGLAAAGPAASRDQSSDGIFVSVEVEGGGHTVSAVEARLRVTGAVTVDFHGDEASGCEESRLCGVSGTVTWDPSGRASLFAYGYREHGQRFEDGFLSIGRDDPFAQAEPTTAARVHRDSDDGSSGSLCADAASPLFAGIGSGPRRGRAVRLSLVGKPGSGIPVTDTFRTRCAGPTAADIGAALPTHVIGERAIRRGGGRLDFSADRPFSAGGLAGTVHSTVVIHVRRGNDVLDSHPAGDPVPTHVRRRRGVRAEYRIESVGGQVVTGVRGLADPDLCGPLDACGLTGSVTTAPNASAGEAFLQAEASLDHPYRDLDRALGLRAGHRPRGVSRIGVAYWDDEHGSVASALTRAGEPACRDSQPLSGPGVVVLQFSGGVVHARYGDSDASGIDAIRTRCPGPSAADVSGARPLATATVPLSTFRGRRVTLHLARGGSYRADGYSGQTVPDVTVVLRRVRVRHYIQRLEVPDGFFGARARRAGADLSSGL